MPTGDEQISIVSGGSFDPEGAVCRRLHFSCNIMRNRLFRMIADTRRTIRARTVIGHAVYN